MQITRLRLFDYRSYAKLDFVPAPGLCVLSGENAAGKTNVLESIFLCALGRSHRTRHDGELIRMGQPGGFVGVDVQKRSGSHRIECRLRREERKAISVDSTPLSRSGELLGCLNVVLFSPEDLRLVKQGPGERRRFMDMELSQLQPAYYYRLQQYNAALRQRNALIKGYPHLDNALLEVWTQQLSSLGAEIMLERARFLERVGKIAADTHQALTGGGEQLTLAYHPALPLQEKAALTEALFSQMMATLPRDSLRGATTAGPHRDDFSLLVDGAQARTYASQGQQRTAALSLKLAELKLLWAERQEPPVLLLDDVLSELDESRQRMLFGAMEGCQTFLTCTHLGMGAPQLPGNPTLYRVSQGRVELL